MISPPNALLTVLELMVVAVSVGAIFLAVRAKRSGYDVPPLPRPGLVSLGFGAAALVCTADLVSRWILPAVVGADRSAAATQWLHPDLGLAAVLAGVVAIGAGYGLTMRRGAALSDDNASNTLDESRRAAAIAELFEALSLPIQILRPCGRRAFANDACVALFGYDSREEFLALPPHALVGPEDAERVRLSQRAFFASGHRPPTHESRGLRKDGSRVWVETRMQLVDWNGESALLMIFIDATHRKEAQEAARRSEKSFRDLIEKSNLAAQVIAEDGTRLFANEAAARMFGYDSPEDLTALPPFSLVVPEGREAAKRAQKNFIASGRTGFRYDHEGLRNDGSRFAAQMHQQIVQWDGADAIFMVHLDVTERNRAEQILRDSEERLKNAERIAKFGNWEIQLGTDKFTVSDQGMRILGLNVAADRPDTGDILAMFHPDDLDAVREARAEAIRTDTPYSVDYRIVRQDGDIRYLRERGEVASDDDGAAVKLSGVVQDVTDLHAAQSALAERESFYKELIELLPEAVYVHADNRVVMANSMTARQFSADSVDDIIGLDPDDLLLPAEMPEVYRRRTLHTGKGTAWPYSRLRYRRLDGTHYHGEGTSAAITWQGRPARLVVVRDITQRLAAERAQTESEERLKDAQRIARVGHWYHTPGTGETAWSEEMYRIYGIPMTGTQRRTRGAFIDMVHPDDRDRLLQDIARATETGETATTEYRIVRADGEIRHVRTIREILPRQDGIPDRLRGVTQDITEQKKAEEALRLSEEAFRALIDGSVLGILIRSTEGKRLYVNRAFREMYGFVDNEDLLNAPDAAFAAPHEKERISGYVAARRSGLQAPVEYDMDGLRRDGTIFPTHVYIREVTWMGQRALQMTVVDLTELERAEEALRASERNFRDMIEASPLGIMVRRKAGDRIYVNRALVSMYGFESREQALRMEGTGMLAAPHARDVLLAYIRRRHDGDTSPVDFDIDAMRVDGTIFPVHFYVRELEWQGEPAIYTAIVDMTELKRAEQEVQKFNQELEARVEQRTAELRQAQSELVKRERLATLGQLTATVSHELRNPLGAMRSSMYVVRKRCGEVDEQFGATLERIDRNITRCDAIIDELLDFTRIRDLQCSPVQLDAWLGEVLDEHPFPEDIRVVRDFGLPGTAVPIDPDRIRRALINALDNAVQAIGENGGSGQSRLRVGTHATDGRVEISISDTGPGIPPDVMPQVFEPLYSTKSFGIGLGLSVVRQIMEQHSGGVEIDTVPGQGTAVTLWVPQHG